MAAAKLSLFLLLLLRLVCILFLVAVAAEARIHKQEEILSKENRTRVEEGGGFYAPTFRSMLPKGRLPSSGPSRRINDYD
ncbi:hypothetical protein M569_13859 [Genlisea aurea]|uniref:Uncharacterized protein n=1 Tax=Genlisea aurea TaxID=192259 RepID=S8DMQ8_9LAMI|nr:hypothetical protein M569_13859 [Genlisea aurea]